MTLEAIVFQQNQISYGSKDHLHNFGIEGENWSYGYGFEESKAYSDETHNNYIDVVCQRERGDLKKWESSPSSMVQDGKEYDTNSSSPEACNRHDDGFFPEGRFPLVVEAPPGTVMPSRPKRRRTRSFKNKDEVENQRMTHITVERNRRKQMNDYLSVLRSLMPPSYVQRGDQASIVGGAINFVKELEQLLQSLESNKQMKQQPTNTNTTSMFSDFFTFPQYSTCSATQYNNTLSATATEDKRSAVADVEVTMVDSHANVKILTKRQPKQLLKMVMRLQSLNLTILHLNITTTVDDLVLYSISVKVEEGCQLTSVNDIATAVYEMVGLIQEESNFGWKP